MRTPTSVTAIVYTIPLHELPASPRPEHIRNPAGIPLRVVDTGHGEVYVEVRENHTDGDWMLVAAARQFRQSQGASFSGWIVECNGPTDPIRGKRRALWHLWLAAEDKLNAHLVYGRSSQRLADAYADTQLD